jgi:hypothetical protein
VPNFLAEHDLSRIGTKLLVKALLWWTLLVVLLTVELLFLIPHPEHYSSWVTAISGVWPGVFHAIRRASVTGVAAALVLSWPIPREEFSRTVAESRSPASEWLFWLTLHLAFVSIVLLLDHLSRTSVVQMLLPPRMMVLPV